jgi:hypothetical protein
LQADARPALWRHGRSVDADAAAKVDPAERLSARSIRRWRAAALKPLRLGELYHGSTALRDRWRKWLEAKILFRDGSCRSYC